MIEADRARSTYVIGANGSGKTTMIAASAEADLQAGVGFGVIDPKRSLVDWVGRLTPASRRDQVVVLDVLHPTIRFGINLFACPDPTNDVAVSAALNRVQQTYATLWGASMRETPQLADCLANGSLAMMLGGGTMLDFSRFLVREEQSFRRMFLDRLPDDYAHVRHFWNRQEKLRSGDWAQAVGSTERRVHGLVTDPLIRSIFGQEASTLDWRTAMDEGWIVLVKLDSERAELTSLVGAALVAQIAQAGLSRGDVGVDERPPFAVYLDEFHRYPTEAAETLLTQGREFNLWTMVAHQHRDQLTPALKGATLQCGNLYVFRVGGGDAAELARAFDRLPVETVTDPTRPIRVPTMQPVAELMRAAPEGTEELAKELRAINERIRMPEPVHVRMIESMRYPFHREGLSLGLEAVNTFLCERMRRPEMSDQERHRLAMATIIPLRGWLGLAPEGWLVPRVNVNNNVVEVWQAQPLTDPQREALLGYADGTGSYEAVEKAFGVKNNHEGTAWFMRFGTWLSTLYSAGEALAENPILVDSGRYVTVPAASGMANQREAIENRLTHLETLHALVKIAQETGVVEAEVVIERPGEGAVWDVPVAGVVWASSPELYPDEDGPNDGPPPM